MFKATRNYLAVLVAALVAVVALAVVGRAAPSQAQPNVPAGHGMIYGINSVSFDRLHAETDGLTAERYYFTQAQGVPKAWPSLAPGVVGVVSFKPNVVQVANGSLDSQIVAFLKTAPPDSWVTIWHEANLANHVHIFTQAQYVAAVKHVEALIKANNIPVKFGQIFGTYAVEAQKQDLSPWVVPGLDFYGLDGYQNKYANRTPLSVFGQSVTDIQTADGANAPVAITETNSGVNADAWFQNTYNYAVQNGFVGYLVFAFPTMPIPSAPLAQLFARESPQV